MTAQGDPRFQRSRDAILKAARRLLLEEGPAAVTHARVSQQAKIARATVYRHWPRTDQLIAEAMATVAMPFFSAPSLPVHDWVRTELTSIARQLELDEVRVVAATLANAAVGDRQMNERRARYAQTLAERFSAALDLAAERGELSLRAHSRDAAALALGPIYYRSTIERAPIDDALIEMTINALGAWRDPKPGDTYLQSQP